MSRKNNQVVNIIIAILSVLLVVAVIGFVFKFTNGLNEDLKTFYIEHNGKQIVATDSQMTFDVESEHRFDCKYLSTPDEDNLFNVEVIPNVTEKTDFNFTVDDVSYKWSELKDLTACFTINKQHNYFIITFPADFSMQSVLNSLYRDKDVVISDTLSLYQYYYTLHISNYNGKINYYIDFNVVDESKGDIIANYDKKINELENNIDDLGLQITTLKNEKATLNNEIENLENNITELQESIKDKNSEISSLQVQITTLENEKETLISENNDNSEKISSLNSQIASLNNQISELQTSIKDKDSKIKDLQRQIMTLTEEKTSLQESIEYYENFVSKYEDDETAVVTLEVDDSVYAMFTMAKGSTMFDIVPPENDYYGFNGWTVNGESVTMDGYEITENTTFVADLTHGYLMTFVADGVTVKEERYLIGSHITPPEIPAKEGYRACWMVTNEDGIQMFNIDYTTYTVCTDLLFTSLYYPVKVNIALDVKYQSTSSSGSGGNTAFSVTPYFGGIDDSSSYGYFSTNTIILSIEEQTQSVTFDTVDDYIYLGFEVNSSSSDITTYALASYPFDVFVSGRNITVTLNSIPEAFSEHQSYTLSIIVTKSSSSSSGSSGSFSC